VGGLSLYVSPDSQLKYLKPHAAGFDDMLLRLAREFLKKDSVVWDIGANVGVFTFAAKGVAIEGRVLAVEPDRWLAQLLQRSSRLQPERASQVAVLCAAISSRNGTAEFSIAKRGRASNHLAAVGGWSQTGGERERFHVPTLTLDTLLEDFPAPTFVKIDVEGAEVLVLGGARRLLHEIRPTFCIEVGEEHASAATLLFHQAGYDLFDAARSFSGQQPSEFCSNNTLAVPKSAALRAVQ
jgi:FkbM family methyltransferase